MVPRGAWGLAGFVFVVLFVVLFVVVFVFVVFVVFVGGVVVFVVLLRLPGAVGAGGVGVGRDAEGPLQAPFSNGVVGV